MVTHYPDRALVTRRAAGGVPSAPDHRHGRLSLVGPSAAQTEARSAETSIFQSSIAP
jgi:hypothetical protein